MKACAACGHVGETRPSLYGNLCINASECLHRIYEQIVARRAKERSTT